MHRSRPCLALASIWVSAAACARSEAPAPAPAPPAPAASTLAHGYGVSIRGVAYVPDDRVQSFGLVSGCTRADGETCGARAWSAAEIDAVTQAALLAGKLSGFETRYDAENPEVRVHARRDATPEATCLNGKDTCWFGATNCAERGDVLVDAAGAPVVDHHATASWSFTRCKRWALEVSVVNVEAWAGFLGIDRLHVLRSVVLHEMGHSLGLEHNRLGLMRAHLPVCYFINPGDPRDRFDPAATADAFQRFDCLEGVKEPELAPGQRAKLDAYQPRGLPWSFSSP